MDKGWGTRAQRGDASGQPDIVRLKSGNTVCRNPTQAHWTPSGDGYVRCPHYEDHFPACIKTVLHT